MTDLPPLPIGTRVRLSAKAIQWGLYRDHPDKHFRLGTIVGGRSLPFVWWDGTKSKGSAYHRSFIEAIEVAETTEPKIHARQLTPCVPDDQASELTKKICALRGKQSAAQIARNLGLKSRNVVIGVWYRNRVRA